MHQFIDTTFFQAKHGEIFAVVCMENENGKYEYKFIDGIERIGYSADSLFEEAVTGFAGHSVIDFDNHPQQILNFFSLNPDIYYSDVWDVVEASGSACIAVFKDNYAEFHLDEINETSKVLFKTLFLIAIDANCEVSAHE